MPVIYTDSREVVDPDDWRAPPLPPLRPTSSSSSASTVLAADPLHAHHPQPRNGSVRVLTPRGRRGGSHSPSPALFGRSQTFPVRGEINGHAIEAEQEGYGVPYRSRSVDGLGRPDREGRGPRRRDDTPAPFDRRPQLRRQPTNRTGLDLRTLRQQNRESLSSRS